MKKRINSPRKITTNSIKEEKMKVPAIIIETG